MSGTATHSLSVYAVFSYSVAAVVVLIVLLIIVKKCIIEPVLDDRLEQSRIMS